MVSAAYVWAKVLGRIEQQMGPIVASSWFDDIEVVEMTEQKLVLYTPSPFRRETIQDRCMGYITEALKELFSMELEVQVLGDEQIAAIRQEESKRQRLDFNPAYTFDNFVVGPSNRFVHAAAQAVAANPAKAYNPLFIHGASGLGKTHLLNAIANQIHNDHPDFSIVYLKGDEFTNELIESVKKGKNVEFRGKYRSADLLLMDDVQFIAGKDSTEEEFFHTYNTLYEANKQIVLTSDRPPEEMLKLSDRLRSRFVNGMVAEVTLPDYETRMAIIKNKASTQGLELPDDVCDFIATNVTNNIRQMEGVVNKIRAYRDLDEMTVDLPSVQRAIKDMYKGKIEALPTPDLIISETGSYYNIPASTLRGTLKNRGTAEARQIAMYLCRKLTNLSFLEIAKAFDRDHSTVIYSINKVEKALSQGDKATEDAIRDLTANINSRL